MKRLNLYIAVLILCAASAAFMWTSAVRAAYNTQQVINEASNITGNSTHLTDLLNKRGLTTPRLSDACLANSVYALYQQGLSGLKNMAINEIAGTLTDLFTVMRKNLIMCAVGGIINHFVPGAGVPCVMPSSSDVTSFLLNDAKTRAKQDFLARCVVDQGINDISNTIDDIVQGQGPGGSPAYATDWISDSYVKPDEQGYRRFWTILVNTDICPYMKEDVYRYFGVPQGYIDNPPSIGAGSLRTNADDPFQLRGACTLPASYIPTAPMDPVAFMANGGYDILTKLAEPQNNLAGFISMASAELRAQRVASIDAVTNQLVAGGGFLPSYGDASENCQPDPEGGTTKCITNGTIRNPPGAIRDRLNDSVMLQGQFLVNSNGTTNKTMEDMATRIQARLLDLANQSLPTQLELGFEDNPANFTPAPTPTPSPGSGDPNDPACTGGNPDCVCVKNDPGAQQISSTIVADAIARAMQVNPELFVNGTNQIAPGANYRLVLQAVCDRMQATQGTTCEPHPSQDDEIVLVSADKSISFDIITADGYVRTNGGQPIAACDLGVQN